MKNWLRRVVLSVSMVLGLHAQAGEITVAVAANFSAPAQRLATAFANTTGHHARLVVGSTGKLYAQVKNGAPFQVFLSADEVTPSRMVSEGLAFKASQFTYATGRLVLWSRQPGLVDPDGAVLKLGKFSHLALADPKLAPYGAAAVEVMGQLGLRTALQPKWVHGESIGQTFQFVSSGNAELGFVALSQVMHDGKMAEGSAWVVPTNMHTALKQDAVLLQRGKDDAVATAFLDYLRSDAAKLLVRGYGYEIP
jgi:molybdate transport system substrate-binding protein